MQEAIAMQIKVGWSYWSSLGRFLVPSSDKHNNMVLTDKQKAVIENDFNERLERIQNLEGASKFWMFPHGSS